MCTGNSCPYPSSPQFAILTSNFLNNIKEITHMYGSQVHEKCRTHSHDHCQLTLSLLFSVVSFSMRAVSTTGTSRITGTASAAFLLASRSLTSISFASLNCSCNSWKADCNFAFSCVLASSMSAYKVKKYQMHPISWKIHQKISKIDLLIKIKKHWQANHVD